MKNKCRLMNILVFVLLGLAVFIPNLLNPWVWDDIFYQFSWADGTPICSISDIVKSQYAHYFILNGRVVAHVICQILLSFTNHFVVAILCTTMAVALLYVVLRLGAGKKFGIGSSITAFALFMLTMPSFFVVSQVGYIWMTLLALLFAGFYLYRAPAVESSRIPMLILLFFFSLLAGNAQESICIGIGGALIIYDLVNIRRLNAAQWVMSIGFGIGGLLLCLAPGILARSERTDISILYTLFMAVTNIIILSLLAITLVVLKLRRKISLKRFYRDNCFFCNAVIVLFLFHMIIGIGASPQLYGMEILSLILLLRALPNHHFGKIITPILCVAVVFVWIAKYSSLAKNIEEYDMIHETLETSNDNDTLFIDLPYNPYYQGLPLYLKSYQVLSGGNSMKSYPTKIVYPTVFEDLIGKGGNHIYEYRPGMYMIVQDREDPARFILHRSAGACGMSLIKLPPVEVGLDDNYVFNTDEYRVLFINSISPFVKNDSVVIIP